MWNACPSARSLPSRPMNPLREVVGVRHDPQRRAVTMHDDRPTAHEPVRQRVGAPPAQSDREVRVVRHRRAHDRRGEALVAVRLHQALFAGDLVAGVLPVGVGERCGLGDEVVGRRLLVRRGRADEDVLPDPAPEQCEVALDVIRRVGDPVDDDVELQAPQRRMHVIRAVDVGGQRHERRADGRAAARG